MRSRRVATLVTRNITIIGNSPTSSGPNWSSTGVPSNIQAIRPISTHGSRMTSAIVRLSWRSWREHPARGRGGERRHPAAALRGRRPEVRRDAVGGVHATAPFARRGPGLVDQGEERPLGVGRAGAREQLVERGVGEHRAAAQQDQPVAAGRLVHHVAGHQQAHAVAGEPVEQVPQVAAQHRVEPHGRLVEDQQVGPAEQRDRQRDPRALPAGQGADGAVGLLDEVDLGQRPRHPVGVDAEDRAPRTAGSP